MLDAYAALREPAAAAYAEWQRPIRPRIDLAWDTSALAAGAGRTLAALEAEAESRGAAVDLGRVHGYGLQWLQPLAQITWPDGASVLYGPVTPDKVGLLLDEATGRAGAAAELALGVISVSARGCRRSGSTRSSPARASGGCSGGSGAAIPNRSTTTSRRAATTRWRACWTATTARRRCASCSRTPD